MVRSSIMDHQQPPAGIIGHQLLQELRKLLLRQVGTDMVVGVPGQRGYGAIDLHRGLIIPHGHLGDLVDHAPLRGQGGMAAQRRLIDMDQLPLLRPLFHQRLQLRPKDCLVPGLGFQVAVPQPTQAKPLRMQQLSHTLPTILATKPHVDRVPHQFGVHTLA
jgi:hypothetical protein